MTGRLTISLGAALVLTAWVVTTQGCKHEEEEGTDSRGDAGAGGDDGAGGGGDDDGDGGLGVQSFAGEYDGVGFDEYGAVRVTVTVAEDGAIAAIGIWEGDRLQGGGQIEEGGDATFSVMGSTDVGEVTLSYTGTFRFEGTNALAWGEWVSSNDLSGSWGIYRLDNDHGLDPTDVERGCTNYLEQCTGGPATLDECVEASGCQAGVMASRSQECLNAYGSLIDEIVAISSPEQCPDFTAGPPQELVDLGCPAAALGGCTPNTR